MFANRFTALVDACSLVSALGRNTLLSLAAAELYRVRWSETILAETEGALEGMFAERGADGPGAIAARQIAAMRRAFPEATVEDYDELAPAADALPDPGDAHVIAAARACRASVIVTENLRHFPTGPLATLGIEVKSSDEFVADAVDLDPALALGALATMRARFEKPELTAEALLLHSESQGFILTADLLWHHVGRL